MSIKSEGIMESKLQNKPIDTANEFIENMNKVHGCSDIINERAFAKHIIPYYHKCINLFNETMLFSLGYNNSEQEDYKVYVWVIKLMIEFVEHEIDIISDHEENKETLLYYNKVTYDMNVILKNLKRWPIEIDLMIRAITNRTNVASNEVCNMIKGFI
tara:strand:+ start:162 stop:635 length:474 start_codon:yes stop_codon:yes gene_type:complete